MLEFLREPHPKIDVQQTLDQFLTKHGTWQCLEDGIPYQEFSDPKRVPNFYAGQLLPIEDPRGEGGHQIVWEEGPYQLRGILVRENGNIDTPGPDSHQASPSEILEASNRLVEVLSALNDIALISNQNGHNSHQASVLIERSLAIAS